MLHAGSTSRVQARIDFVGAELLQECLTFRIAQQTGLVEGEGRQVEWWTEVVAFSW